MFAKPALQQVLWEQIVIILCDLLQQEVYINESRALRSHRQQLSRILAAFIAVHSYLIKNQMSVPAQR